MTRDDIITEARRFVAAKTRWAHQGRSITGCDCVGLVCAVANAFDVPYTDLTGYSRNPDGKFVDHVKRHLVWREPQTPQHGCVAVLREQHRPCHIGFIAESSGQLYLIHASLARRQVVEEEWTASWKARVRCYLDFPGVED